MRGIFLFAAFVSNKKRRRAGAKTLARVKKRKKSPERSQETFCQVSIREKVFHKARLRLPAHFFCVINFA
jgi:hypothetical protein